MAKLRGRGMGIGRAMGAAAIVRSRGGIAVAPQPSSRIVAAAASAMGVPEIPDVILVAEEYRAALALVGGLPWANVVGIAARDAEPDAPTPPVPAVVGIEDLMDAVEDDMLFLVDSESGTVLADPDGASVAFYQAQRHNIAPRRRFYLDDAHIPAKTDDGRAIDVAAWVATAGELETAIGEGADALYVPFNCPLLPILDDEEDMRRALLGLVDMAAGIPIVLSDRYALPLTPVLEASARAVITLSEPLRPDLEGWGIGELSREIAETHSLCFERGVNISLPRLAANLRDLSVDQEEDAIWLEAAAENGAARVVLSLEDGGELLGQILSRVSGLVGAGNANMIPLACRLTPFSFMDDTLETSVRCLVGVGVFAILTARVREVKSIVCELNYSECEEAVLHGIG